ncbi:hypothetical protein RJ639_006424 [Escallonia herrerae]|uniref:Pentatricopeptide repeat-containing protein n=1 Tax=Escallonia herrerae TaxID=1293975 RepID=A0AA89AUL6_9ASTE|nr:hypothetical protein RJ639_006424 [Escallonia herrerae]
MPRLGVSPNDISYTPLVKAHVKAGKLGCAFDTLSIMIKNLCRPNHQIYSALLAGFVLSDIGKEAGALSSISDLNTGETSVDCSSNYIFTAMDFTLAVTLLDKIKECGGETVDLYNFLIMGLCRVGRTCEADRLMQDMVKLGLFPDKDVCSFVVEHFCGEQKYDHCLEWMKPILDKRLVLSFASYCSVVRAIGNEGEVTQAQRLVSDLIRHAGIKDRIAVSRHIEFLVKEDEPYKRLELLNLIEQMKVHLAWIISVRLRLLLKHGPAPDHTFIDPRHEFETTKLYNGLLVQRAKDLSNQIGLLEASCGKLSRFLFQLYKVLANKDCTIHTMEPHAKGGKKVKNTQNPRNGG